MTAVPRAYAASVQAAVDAFAARCNSGYLRIYSGSQPALDAAVSGTLLAELAFGATAFGASSAAAGTVTATANAITSDTSANATGTAGYFALVMTGGSTVVATGTVGTSGCDLNLNAIDIVSGASVAVTAFTVTQSQT